jgi:hypothetical protein
MVNLLGSDGLQVTVSSRIDPFPPMGLEPATCTSEALVAQSACKLAFLKQLIMPIVYIPQFDSAGTVKRPKLGNDPNFDTFLL